MNDAGLGYCGELVRRVDPDRFQAALFAPAARREALFALYAFNHELAKTAEVVSEPMLGRIRLQWWRESLEGMFAGQPRRHAVLEPLSRAVRDYGLSREPFERLIDMREQDLVPEPPGDVAALVDYAEGTGGALALLALDVLGARDPASRRAVLGVGTAWALTGLLRAVRFHARHKRLYLPGVDPGQLFELRSSADLRAAVRDVAEIAHGRLSAARVERRGVARQARPVLLVAVLAERCLDLLANAGHDPLVARVYLGRFERAARLLLAAAAGRY